MNHYLRKQTLAALAIAACLLAADLQAAPPQPNEPHANLFARDNLIAWCIVPFDAKKRGPEERAAMLERLGFKHYAYDWRAEHLPTFEAELDSLKRHGVALDAVWFPSGLDQDARFILDVLAKHGIKTQLWVTGGGEPTKTPEEQRQRVKAEAARIRPIAEAAAKINCTVGLYNHGGWFGEPENQLAIIDELKLPNVGIVYNLHHGHDHLDRFAAVLDKMKPHLLALNLNGMTREGDRRGQKILPLGQGDLDLELLKTIRSSGYRGPIGILGHTMDDAEQRLADNLDGLDWLVPQLDGKQPEPKPKPRTVAPTSTASSLSDGWLAAGRDEYRQPPLTVDCWARLNSKQNYNILIANDTKQSGAHWELFSMAGDGRLTVYMPGMQPDHVRSEVDICDRQWHHLAMQFEPERVRLYCDGRQ
ncbi:MAG TPA: TIM barrel protein, partial [Pirellulales bacterium]|nr:TIM barrel protein [Pirellulales bacterium]